MNLTTAMRIGGGCWQCRRKYHSMRDLQWQKNTVVMFSVSVVFIFTTYIIADYF